MILRSQLYGRARNLAFSLSFNDLKEADGTDKIVSAVYTRDPMSVVSEVFPDFHSLLNTKRGQNESFKNFESRFAAQYSNLTAHGINAKLPEPISAMLSMSNSCIDDAQRVSMLAATAKGDDAKKPDSKLKTNDYISIIKYSEIASVIRRRDKSNFRNAPSNLNTFPSNSASKNRTNFRNNGNNRSNFRNHTRNRNILSPTDLAQLKRRYQCRSCGNYGHWSNDHQSDGTIRNNLPNSTAPLEQPAQKPSDNKHTNQNHNNSAGRNNTMNIGNANVICGSFINTNDINVEPEAIGPLVHDGAPYSALGLDELSTLRNTNRTSITLDPLPHEIRIFQFWKYGIGAHSSSAKRIIGCKFISSKSKLGNTINIRHLVTEGSSQFVIGRNVTRPFDIIHIGAHEIRFDEVDEVRDAISLIDHNRLSYIIINSAIRKKPVSPPIFTSSGFSATIADTGENKTDFEKKLSWTETKRIVDKVHHHVCGHSPYSDMRTLLTKNGLWNSVTQHYLSNVVKSCKDCVESSTPPPSRKVSPATSNRKFNKVVAVDHFYLYDIKLIHFMDTVTRFSACLPCSKISMEEAIFELQTVWINPFWNPQSIYGEQAFLADSLHFFETS